jgi:hypothetical protein
MYKIDFNIEKSKNIADRMVFTLLCRVDDVAKVIDLFVRCRDGFEIVNITIYPA